MKQKIILLSGDIGVGKTHLANIFVKNGFTKESFAHTLKELAYTLMFDYFDMVVPEMVYGDYNAKNVALVQSKLSTSLNASLYFEYWLRHQKISLLDDKTIAECKVKLFKMMSKKNITPREILQFLGTEIMRDIIHKDFHALSLSYKILDTNCNIIIDDYRFLNEYQILKNKKRYDVYAIRINKEGTTNKMVNHKSENQSLHFDNHIYLHKDELISDKNYNEIMEFVNGNNNINIG